MNPKEKKNVEATTRKYTLKNCLFILKTKEIHLKQFEDGKFVIFDTMF